MRAPRRLIGVLAATMILVGVGAPAVAQETSDPGQTPVRLLAPYVGVSVKAGDDVSFSFDVLAPTDDEVAISVTDLPEGWTAEIRGGGFVVDRIVVDETLNHNLKLDVGVPAGTPDGTYPLMLEASGPHGTDRLEFDLTVTEAAGGGVSLTSEFPDLRGAADANFSYTLELSNDTTEEIQFGLQGEGPPGWQVDARPASKNQASTITVAAGASERITVDVDPPDFTAAGTYPLTVSAAGGGLTATAQLAAEIIGSYDLGLSTQDQRLNLSVKGGSSADLQLVVSNDGTAPLTDVTLSATPPSGWEVTFEPDSIPRIEPGAVVAVAARVTPSDQAINGDYRLTMRARVAQTSDQIEIRTTVETSTFWGVVGIAIILLALTALALVFRRFGRR